MYNVPLNVYHFSKTFSQLNEVCEMQTNLHCKHYDIDKDNPISSQLKNDLSQIKAVNGIYEEMKKLSEKISSLTADE